MLTTVSSLSLRRIIRMRGNPALRQWSRLSQRPRPCWSSMPTMLRNHVPVPILHLSATRFDHQWCPRQPHRFFFSTSPVGRLDPSISKIIGDKIRAGTLVHDSAQERAAERLSRLQSALDRYDNTDAFNAFDLARRTATAKSSKVLPDAKEKNTNATKAEEEDGDADDANICEAEIKSPKVDAKKEIRQNVEDGTTKRIAVPRGMFLYGAVGTGKSMLMDCFYEQAAVARKRRVHFHSFMANVHKRIHDMKQRDLAEHGRSFTVDISEERNPIRRVATELAGEVSLLCFDEFQVTDVADALILSQLFGTLWARGVVVVATSNRPPGDLYAGGLNRGYFLPFIDLLRRHCVVHEFKSSTDYRRLLSEGMDEFFFVADNSGNFDQANEKCSDIFEQILGGVGAHSIELDVAFNRTILVREAHPDGVIGRFTFDELCKVELGSSDYRSIAQEFQFVLIENIPFLTLKEHDQARRFITLVDELYEARCALLCSAVAPPDELFIGREGAKPLQSVSDGNSSSSIETKVGEMFGIDVAQSNDKSVGELASVRELAFAFERASSRLTEMCSKSWWQKAQL